MEPIALLPAKAGPTQCNRCGDCCQVFWIDEGLIARAKTGETVVDERSTAWLLQIVPLTPEKAKERGVTSDAQYYECPRFDQVNKLCTAHDERPDVCRGFPWYGGDPRCSMFHRPDPIYSRCSFKADIVPQPLDILDDRNQEILIQAIERNDRSNRAHTMAFIREMAAHGYVLTALAEGVITPRAGAMLGAPRDPCVYCHGPVDWGENLPHSFCTACWGVVHDAAIAAGIDYNIAAHMLTTIWEQRYTFVCPSAVAVGV